MTNTAKLIERLTRWPLPDCPLPSEALADMREAAEALSILTRPPLALSDEQYAEFLRALDEPPPPNEKLISMMVRYRLAKAASAAQPLPEEIAGLIKLLRNYHSRTGAYAPEATCRHGIHPYDCESGCAPITFNAAAALERLARENSDLIDTRKLVGANIMEKQAGRIRELEAERDAIRAKMIEECIGALDGVLTETALLLVMKTLRALNQPAES